jgi:hypothetical protein
MKEIIRFWFLKRIIKDAILSAEIYQMLYHKKTFVTPNHFPITKVYEETEGNFKTNPNKTISQFSDRKKQLIDSLKVLMDKKIKTNQDKESIEILRAVLQNEK